MNIFKALFSDLSHSRYRIGIVGGIALALCIIIPQLNILVTLVAMGFSAWGVHELIRLADARKYDPSHLVALPFSVMLTWLGILDHRVFIAALPVALSALIIMAFVSHMLVYGSTGALSSVPITVFSTLYVGLSFGLGLHLVYHFNILALMICLGTWATDSGAFIIGCRYGKHKMAPRLSPKKSWEGLIGGILTCMLVCWVYYAIYVWLSKEPFPITLIETLCLGALVAVVSVVGDLSESILKRDADIKDSGHIFGGHGGLLDRTDSLLFVFLTTYFYLSVLGYLN